MNLRARILGLAGLAAAALAVSATGPAQADSGVVPGVAALNVTQVGQTWARIAGAVTPGDDATSFSVEYGRAPLFNRSTAPIQVNGRGAVPVSVTLIGLATGTTYQVRLVAETRKARVETPTVTFTTRTPAVIPTLPAPQPSTDPAPDPDPAADAPAIDPAPAEPAPAVPVPAPALADTVVVVPSGTIGVRVPGSDEFRTLGAAESIPVGSVIDATDGSITLNAAQESGPPQTGRFGGGRFVVRQHPDADGYVDLHLRGGDLARCSRSDGTRKLASAAATRPRRKLWGRDRHARFRTHGRDSVATVRGTRWSMTDRCGGTLTRVSEGAVDVRVRSTGRVVRVHAGETQFARHRG